jgi:hypothetical protein
MLVERCLLRKAYPEQDCHYDETKPDAHLGTSLRYARLQLRSRFQSEGKLSGGDKDQIRRETSSGGSPTDARTQDAAGVFNCIFTARMSGTLSTQLTSGGVEATEVNSAVSCPPWQHA